jgi:hypothetical protein
MRMGIPFPRELPTRFRISGVRQDPDSFARHHAGQSAETDPSEDKGEDIMLPDAAKT